MRAAFGIPICNTQPHSILRIKQRPGAWERLRGAVFVYFCFNWFRYPSASMASGVKLLFSHQLTSAAAMVRPVLTSCSSWADSMGSTAWPVALSSWLVRASASAAEAVREVMSHEQ